MSSFKDVKKVLKSAKQAGLEVVQSNSTHYRITNPNTGKFVMVSSTSSCVYAANNAKRDIRKYLGVEL